MSNKVCKFRTDLKCANCVAKVQEKLDEVVGKGNWSVDLKDPARVLTVVSEGECNIPGVEKALAVAGYKAILQK